MQRLFIGLSVPETIRERLVLLQPKPSGKVRPVDPAHMHLTLHFIGQAEAQPIAEALHGIKGEAFSLAFTGPGRFGSARRGGILWMGVEQHAQLSELHSALAEKLADFGIELEARAFTPHITLARYRRAVHGNYLNEFLNQSLPPMPPLPVTEFVLYSSKQTQGGPVYTREFAFLLDETRGSTGT